jgi:hypothetical protein
MDGWHDRQQRYSATRHHRHRREDTMTMPKTTVRYIILSALLASCGGGDKPTELAAPTVTQIALTPTSTSFSSIGRSATLAATAKDASGNTMTLPAIQWASSDATIASVDQSGKIAAVKDGDATITATFTSSIKGTSTVSVRAAIDLKFFVSAVANTSLVAANDTATVKLVVTDKP